MATDFHCHLQSDCYDHDLEQVVLRAKTVGVNRFFCNATDVADWKKTFQVAERFSEIVPCFGIHPVYVDNNLPEDWPEQLRNILREADERFQQKTPIGEVGLDHYVSPRSDALQEQVFRKQLQIAREECRAVMLHTRYSLDRVVAILREEQPIPVSLFHGFSGPLERVSQIVHLNGYFSFSANLLKSNHKKTRNAAAALPLERILLESDAPDMPPPPERTPTDWPRNGSPRNEPSILPEIQKELADICEVSLDKLKNILDTNKLKFQENSNFRRQ